MNLTLHFLVTHATSIHYLWTILIILLPKSLLLLPQNALFLTTYHRLLELHLFQLPMVTWWWSPLSDVSMAFLVLHSTLTSLLVYLFYNFLSLILLFSIFLHIQLLVYYDATRLFLLLTSHSLVCKPFSPSIPNLPLSATHPFTTLQLPFSLLLLLL